MSYNSDSEQSLLIAEYTLGLLDLRETAQAHTLLGQDSQAVAAALEWENKLLELTDLLPAIDPSPLLLQRIQTALGHETVPAASSLYRLPDAQPAVVAMTPAPVATPPIKAAEQAAVPNNVRPLRSDTAATKKIPADHPAAVGKRGANIWLWRGASVVFALIALALALMPAQPVIPPVTIVEVAPTRAAILQAPGQSSTPAWVVTVDPQGNVLMDPQVHSDVSADSSVQLWTHNKSMPQPRSLGIIDPNKPVTVPATLIGPLSTDQIFEMTLEAPGGSPTASPTGPILFIGRLVTFGKPTIQPDGT